jgi:hypothetical protein
MMAPLSSSDDEVEETEQQEQQKEQDTTNHIFQKFVSRYVTTSASSDQLHCPADATIIQPETFDRLAGMTAINETIQTQQALQPRQDPFASYRSTCVKGDIPAGILPRIQLGLLTTFADDDDTDGVDDKHTTTTSTTNEKSTTTKTTSSTTTSKTEISMLRVDFSMLSLPDPKSNLYSLWPSLKKHLGTKFPIEGPYCYGNDPKRAYTIQLSYDSTFERYNNQTWHALKGCYPDLPCWNDNHEIPAIPYDNGNSGTYILDPMGVAALICYLFGFLLVVSLIFNIHLSNQLKLLQHRRGGIEGEVVIEQERRGRRRTEPTAVPQQEVFDAFHDLEEPLLGGGGDSGGAEGNDDVNVGGVDESKEEG